MRAVEETRQVSFGDVHQSTTLARFHWEGGYAEALGGGQVAGSCVLLAGEPGAGKSTLAAQIAITAASYGMVVQYHCGEQTPEAVVQTMRRLMPSHLSDADLATLVLTTGPRVQLIDNDVHLLIVDSIQSVESTVPGGGQMAQIERATHELVVLGHQHGHSTIIIGQITKSMGLAGPKKLEHAVDAVLKLTNDHTGGEASRRLKATKNRSGPADVEVGYRMTETGLLWSEIDPQLSTPAPTKSRRSTIVTIWYAMIMFVLLRWLFVIEFGIASLMLVAMIWSVWRWRRLTGRIGTHEAAGDAMRAARLFRRVR